jgi:hypothetical protein
LRNRKELQRTITMNWSPNYDVETCSLNELWYEAEKKIKKVAVITVGYAQKKIKRSGLTRSVPRLMRKRTLQEYGRSKFKTKAELQKSLQ